MKYIRTKDGIYQFVKITNGYYECNSYVDTEKKISCFVMIKKKDIIKQANTIEELCDVVVYVRKGYSNFVEHIKDFQNRNKKLFVKDLMVYGAIWTDKGLIYVAKMNEKGELCLL